ncbi:hypothetical protein ST37_13835 [Vibrio sp. qd031]|uniref:DUF3316 domain-containing protein n=1 Tax=Vibrio sp. qd031 TaxID=1603038 RepID=UPI000A109EF2|nr:DUF3316 domain-containing protein [Vibrio sp. qd031]ORT49474.1 hypothetical protein ST37_13835 [Vibrio sp. qd031]
MRALTVLSAALLMSSAAFAGEMESIHTNQNAIFMSDAVATQAEAETLGAAYIEKLSATRDIDLAQSLPTPHRKIDRRSMSLDSTEMNVISEEADDGTMEYFAQVEIGYSYSYRDEK